jgi:hypothetical protein|tara:strand:- start:329 stop:613 length:285 start_codon:yes stop_codon:yes gene_type:complete
MTTKEKWATQAFLEAWVSHQTKTSWAGFYTAMSKACPVPLTELDLIRRIKLTAYRLDKDGYTPPKYPDYPVKKQPPKLAAAAEAVGLMRLRIKR